MKIPRKIRERIIWLDKQIEIQQNALMKAHGQEMYVHGYLLQKVTNEWCALVEKYDIPEELLNR